MILKSFKSHISTNVSSNRNFAGLYMPTCPQRVQIKNKMKGKPYLNKKMNVQPAMPSLKFSPQKRESDLPLGLDLMKYGHFQVPLYYQIPVMIVEGRGQYLFDEDGNRYLDMFGADGTVILGHNHPLIVEKLKEQSMKLFQSSQHYLTEEIQLACKELLSTMPDKLNTALFVNTEMEAIELSVLLARLYTRNSVILSQEGSFYGMSHLCNTLSGLSLYKYPVQQAADVVHLRPPNFYRSSLSSKQHVLESSIRDAVLQIRASTSGVIAACLIESVQSSAGVNIVHRSYLSKLILMTKIRKGLVIFNESSTAFFRNGKFMWGFNTLGVTPDILIISKGLANGGSLAAVVTSKEIASSLKIRSQSSSLNGGPMMCALALTVLRCIKDLLFQENAIFLASYLEGQLSLLKRKHASRVGDIRSAGLLAGIEIVKDTMTKEPDAKSTSQLHEILKNRGVLTGKGGMYQNVITICPPLCINEEDINFFITQFDASLSQLSSEDQEVSQHITHDSRMHDDSGASESESEADNDCINDFDATDSESESEGDSDGERETKTKN